MPITNLNDIVHSILLKNSNVDLTIEQNRIQLSSEIVSSIMNQLNGESCENPNGTCECETRCIDFDTFYDDANVETTHEDLQN